MRKKLLFKEDKELYRKWASEFIRIYQDDNKRLLQHEVWFEVKAKEEGYEIRYDNAFVDFWDTICELTR
jgi:hypothetical protein